MRGLVVALLAGSLAAACSTGLTEPACEAGQTQACLCSAGVAGTTACRADRTGWEDCVCTGADADADADADGDADAEALEEADAEVCTPTCTGRTCGPDGCGGSCGACADGQSCTPEGVCAGWWRGNLHTHSNLSDGDSAPSVVAARYRELGYDFLFLTDHGGWSDFARYSTDDFLALDGEELASAGHVNALHISATIPTATRTIQQLVDVVLAAGGVPVLNHPAWTSLPLGLTDLWPITGASLMEIHNHITDLGFDEVLWDGLLTSGRLVFGVAADDCHALATRSGKAWVVVRSVERTADALLAALVRGEFYASTGPELTDVVATSDTLTVDSVDGVYIEFTGAGGRVLDRALGPSASYALDGSERYVRARVTSAAGKAWTQPVRAASFERDPYADAVVAAVGLDPAALGAMLGPPYLGRVPSDWQNHGPRISAGQHVDLDMGEGEEVLDGDGMDLYVEEVDAEDLVGGPDAYEVLASTDGSTWASLGTGAGDASFDLADGGLSSARYVRIGVATGDAEIDAVMYLDPILRDPNADVVVEATGRTEGLAPNVLGPPFPGAVPSPWTFYGIGIGAGGRLIVDMGPGEEILDGPGMDLAVEEIGADEGGADDPYQVSASADGVTWAVLGDGTGDGEFDLAAGGLALARYVLLDVPTGNAEFDAVTAIPHSTAP